MKVITRYEATDGTIWNRPEDALGRDVEVAAVQSVMYHLGEQHHDPLFSNGTGYFQRDPETISAVRLALWNLTREQLRWWWEDQKTEEEVIAAKIHPSAMGYLLDDGHPASKAWARLMCIDAKGREWGQPYFANHPDEAEQVCLGATVNTQETK